MEVGVLSRAMAPRNFSSISTTSANSPGQRRFVSPHLARDWKGQATQAERSKDQSQRDGLPVGAVAPGHPGLDEREFVTHRSREVFMRMASSVEMPSHISTPTPGGTRCPRPSPSISRILRQMGLTLNS